MSEDIARSPHPIPHRGVRTLSRVFVILGALLLLLAIGLLAIALLLWFAGWEKGGPSGIVAIMSAVLLSALGIIGGLLGILTIVSGAYLRRMQAWTWRLAVVTTALRSLAIGFLTVAFYYSTRSWQSSYVLLFLIPEIIVAIYLRKFRRGF
jgi:hypothetical protein